MKSRKQEVRSPKPEARRPKHKIEKREPAAGSHLPEFEKRSDEIPHGGTGILADTFGIMPDSINEKLGSLRDDNRVPDYLKAKPLSSLAQAIGINDRFLFIRELFNGSPDSYNEAISKIDQAGSLSDAREMMTNFTGDKSESEVARQLYDLVKRKF